jgi:hypothetical protein
MLLGHPTYLKAKAGGENSMSGKAGCNESAKLHAGRDPHGMVKAELPEPQCPRSKHGSGWKRRMRSNGPPECPSDVTSGRKKQNNDSGFWKALLGEQVTYCDPKDTKKAPKPS